MAVTLTAQERRGPNVWYFAWSSDATPPVTYYIYLDGVLVETTTRAWKIVQATGGAVAFEVLDDTSAPTEVDPRGLLITSQTDAEAAQYRVEAYEDGGWVTKRTYLAMGESYFAHQTGVLDDDTVHTWRVVAVSAAGIGGTEKEISAHVVGLPDLPAVTYTRNASTGVVTCAAA